MLGAQNNLAQGTRDICRICLPKARRTEYAHIKPSAQHSASKNSLSVLAAPACKQRSKISLSIVFQHAVVIAHQQLQNVIGLLQRSKRGRILAMFHIPYPGQILARHDEPGIQHQRGRKSHPAWKYPCRLPASLRTSEKHPAHQFRHRSRLASGHRVSFKNIEKNLCRLAQQINGG